MSRIIALFSLLALVAVGAQAEPAAIVCPADAAPQTKLAAKELRRYLYLRTGELANIVQDPAGRPDRIVLKVDPALGAEGYRLKGDGKSLEIAGGSPVAVLYGAYRYAERLGVRFYLDGDVVPDERLPALPVVAEETETPIFATRGILPFHDFPEGPDWWRVDDYRACVEQLAKMRMNFFGMHAYNWEPLVWRGVAEDVAADGSVLASYPAEWFHAAKGNGCWGLQAVKTGDYTAGAAELFAEDDMRSEIEGADGRVFDHVARMLGTVVKDAHAVGVKVCVGTESPLHIPGPAAQRLQALKKGDRTREVYRGIFTWLKKNAPVDYYWAWTPEGWIWGGNSPAQAEATAADFKAALAALDDVGRPFPLATSGWVLGPQQNRSAWDQMLPPESPMANINPHVGHAPVDPAFADIKNRPKWAIPWFEGDPDKTGYQPWVGRMRYDAADAKRLGCTGLVGIHWRTKILAQNASALAQAAWNQRWAQAQPMQKPAFNAGTAAAFGQPVAAATPQSVYQTLRYGLDAYPIDLPNGVYTVTLKFNEPHYGSPGKRVFDVAVQGKAVAENLDVFARVGKDRACDITVSGVAVTDGLLRIRFIPRVEYPFLAAVEAVGIADARTAIAADGQVAQLPAGPHVRRINVGGPAVDGYEACLAQSASPLAGMARTMPVDDFYLDFCAANFGAGVAPSAAAVLAAADGFTVAFTKEREYAGSSCWGIRLVNEPWEQMRAHYRFAEAFVALRPQVSGVGNLERFDYWAGTFKASELMMRLACGRGEFEAAMRAVGAEKDPVRRKPLAEAALALRLRLVRQHEELMRQQIALVSTPGELGTLAALEQHGSVWRQWLVRHDAVLAAALGRPLPPEAAPAKTYAGKPRLINLTHRGKAAKGETLNLRIVAIDQPPVKAVVVRVRPLGGPAWQERSAIHAARGVWQVALPAATEDFEYHLVAETAGGQKLVWPATAPQLNQSVVVAE